MDEKFDANLGSYIDDISETVRMQIHDRIAMLTPWFFTSMPDIYYQTTPRIEKVRHLSSILTGLIFEAKQTVELWDPEQTKVTYIGPGEEPTILLNVASKLSSIDIKMGALYFSTDKQLFLANFWGKTYSKLDLSNSHVENKIAEAKALLRAEYPTLTEEIEQYFQHLDHDFVTYATPVRIQAIFRMCHHMLTHEGAHTFVEIDGSSSTVELMLGLKGIRMTDVLESIFHLFPQYNVDLLRSFMVQFQEGYAEPINVMNFTLHSKDWGGAIETSTSLRRLIKSLRTLAWVDSDGYAQFTKLPYRFSIGAANLIRSLASWVHILLGKVNTYYYSNYKIESTFLQNQAYTESLVELFRYKFDPLYEKERQGDGYEKRREVLVQQIGKCNDPIEKRIFQEGVKFIDHLLKTNYFLPTKTGLAFRLDPSVLDVTYYPERPFGIFFITGRDYRFFHIRWRDVARGGLRVVMPKNMVEHGCAIAGLFDEAYGLSQAQQMKNKDIPEGGSKGVLVLKPQGNKARAVRGAINALLDLLVSEDEAHEGKSGLISYYKEEEILFLGPDENMTNDLIVWVPEQAERRNYRYAKAFMSSKPGDGINHKEYGVTSEGLHVFVDHVLQYLDFEPRKKPFTIKMTGGPDGDVAGNELNILHREYGENARVVAISDGMGAAYDPEGLDWSELLTLVREEKSIGCFRKEKLSRSQRAFVIQMDTPENIQLRNHLHATVDADIFIPAGGRPYTVNDVNWAEFLVEGRPTCKAIIEGANIFFTTQAREKLQEQGILIIKDSSANKTGVICSSFEIIASLLLTSEEFYAIKDQYVKEVLERLREKAALEANLLFSEYKQGGGRKTLVQLSKEISEEINQVTDLLLEAFTQEREKLLEGELFRRLLVLYCPPVLREKYEARLFTLPHSHIVAILAASIASYIVYREGLGWLESIDKKEQYQTVLTYMQRDRFADQLIQQVEESALGNREEIVAILKKSAAKDLTLFALLA